MKRIFLTLFLAFLSIQAQATDFFKDREPLPFEKGALMERWSTIGGYSIYTGGELWRILDVESHNGRAIGDADSISRGTVTLVHLDSSGQFQAVMWVTTNLTYTGKDQFVTGSPCSGDHIVAINKGRGREDNCMTIDAASVPDGQKNITVFDIRVINFKSSGRSYVMMMRISDNALNFSNTTPADWSASGQEASPERKAFIARMRTWAESLQDASIKAIDFSKPQDAFDNVPSYKSLISSP
jgi:hypothetical protein